MMTGYLSDTLLYPLLAIGRHAGPCNLCQSAVDDDIADGLSIHFGWLPER